MSDAIPDDLDLFCRSVYPRLVGMAALYVGDVFVGEEIAQEALLRLVKHWRKVRELEYPEGWLHRVAINLGNSWFRHRAVARRSADRLTSRPLPAGSDLADAMAVRAAIAGLPRRQRAAVLLRYYLDLPVDEAAVLLGVSPGALRQLTHRALLTLGPQLDTSDDTLRNAMSADIRDRLQRAAPTGTGPLDMDALWDRARRRQRRRRTGWGGAVATTAAVAVGLVVSIGAFSETGTVSQVEASTPQLVGSANMPDTFVATDFNNEVDVVNSHTGQVETVLLPSSQQPVDSIATTPTDVYVALYETGGSRIVRVARHGGPPSTIATGDDFFLAVSPNGQSLAWETMTPVPSGTSPTRATPNTVSVEDLASGVTKTWALNSVPDQTHDTYGIWGITWTSNTQLVILSTSYNAVTNASGGCQGTPAGETCTAPPEPVDDAYLTTITTTTPSSESPASVGFSVPPITQPPGNGSLAAHFFTTGTKPGTYLLAARSAPTDPVTIYQATLTGAHMEVGAIQQLSKNQYPTSIDSDRQDILITTLDFDTHTGYIARSTNGANPVNLNATRIWADATW